MNRPVRSAQFAKKSLGQNFLSDQTYISNIITAVSPSGDDLIFEIGPGRGAITKHLVNSGANFVAIELDRDLIEPLRDQFSAAPNFKVIEADALDVDFRALIPPGELPQTVKLVANLPYYISTAILEHLAHHRDAFSELILMFQREVVDRIVAQPGNSDRGFLTVLVEECFLVEKLFDVPPSAFRPQPKIWSSVARLVPKHTGRFEFEALKLLAGTAFGQKRKTILNNLKGKYPDAKAKLDAAGIDPGRRAESLTNAEWHELLRALG